MTAAARTEPLDRRRSTRESHAEGGGDRRVDDWPHGRIVLGNLGCEVDVYERSRVPLEGRGVGIVLHPMTVRYLLDNQLLDLSAVSTAATYHRYLADDGSVLSEDARRHHFTGYNTLYGTLLRAFGRERYHLASEATSITDSDDGVEIAFASGEARHRRPGRGRDGVSSFIRRAMVPDVQPRYGGSGAWRRVIHEKDLTPRDVRRAGRLPDLLLPARDPRPHLPHPELRRRGRAGTPADEPGLVPQRAGGGAAGRPAHRPVGEAARRVPAARRGPRRAPGRLPGDRARRSCRPPSPRWR